MLQLYRNIKKRRIDLGMTQTELAHKVGYTDKSMIAKVEKGQVDLSNSKILAFADALQVEPGDLMGYDGVIDHKIPIYGSVAAGSPLEMIEVLDYLVDDYDDEHFALVIHGDSMAPEILDGDIAIVHRQETAESGDIVIATVNGDTATCKKIRLLSDGLELIPINPDYAPFEFTAEQVEKMPVRIIGKVVVTRREWR